MKDYKNEKIVIDTSTSWIYIGTLVDEDETYYYLEDADAFDISETSLSKQEYLMMIKKDGIVPNRKRVKVLKSKVVGISLVKDILVK
ncbi:MAG: hypothetical protein NC921_00735 [Candidatus Omnitrophica bacterium]|nr:hypothetical protein [Candidatus Omnitrophota bacterium]MCM8809232.1 hypothetical protein [Candidatus Omnitrophota bacterium]MCM8810510.1 hypothetical protein [Candidatus Omnitrophota bacterium]